MGKVSFLNKLCWENCITTCTLMKLNTCLIQLKKNNSKWDKDLNVKLKTKPKIPRRKYTEKLLDIGLDNTFLDMTQKTQA